MFIILPHFCSFINGTAADINFTGERRFVLNILSISSDEAKSIAPYMYSPALLISTSILFFFIKSVSKLMFPQRSHTQYPFAPIVFSASSFLPVTNTFPSGRSSSAMARPIPFDAPVTSMFMIYTPLKMTA